MRYFQTASVLFILVLLAGACKEKCKTPAVYAGFSGFDSSELEQIVIKRYKTNSDYTTLVATNYSSILNSKPYQATYEDGDTIGYFSISKIDIKYDYEFILPIPNRTFRLGQFSVDRKTVDWNPTMTPTCGNTVYYYLDGKLGSGDGYLGTNNHYGDLNIGLAK